MRRFTSLLVSVSMLAPVQGASATEYVFRKPIDPRPASELCNATVGQVFSETNPGTFAQATQALRDRSKACADAKASEQGGAQLQPLSLSLSGMPAGRAVVGDAFSAKLTAANASGAVAYAVTAGALPDGVTLSQGGSVSGSLLRVGIYAATLTATDSAGRSQSAAFALQVVDPSPQVAIASQVVDQLFPGDAYAAQATLAGGTGPLAWSLDGPAWLSIDPGTGKVSGTVPHEGKSFSYGVSVTDSLGRTGSATGTGTVQAIQATAELPASVQPGKPLTGRFRTNLPGATWAKAEGPDWVAVATDGTVSGTAPSVDADADVTVAATATAGARRAVATGTVKLVAEGVSVLNFPVAALAGDAVAAQAATTLGAGVAWTLENAPAWLSIDASGKISGTVDGGASGIVVRATKGVLTAATRPLSIVLLKPDLAVTDFPAAIRSGAKLSAGLSTTIKDGTWAFSSDPDGFRLSASGTVLTGQAPTVDRDTDFTLSLVRKNPKGADGTAVLPLTVVPALAFTSVTKGISAVIGTPVATRPKLANAQGTVRYALLKGDGGALGLLDACGGLSFSYLTGAIEGTPTKACTIEGAIIAASDDGGDRPATASTLFSDPFTIEAKAAAAATGIAPPPHATPTGVEGEAFAIQYTSDLPNTVWSIPSGPAWMKVDQTGLVTGVYPETAVTGHAAYEVLGVSGTTSGRMGASVTWLPGTVTVVGLSGGYVAGTQVTGLSAVGTMGEGRWFSLSGQPGWLGIDPVTGVMSGTVDPARPAKGVTVTATKNGASATSAAFDIAIAPARVTLVGSPFSVDGRGVVMMQATSNLPAPNWSLVDAPAWLTVSEAGVVAGTAPTVDADLAVSGKVRAEYQSTVVEAGFTGRIARASSLSLDAVRDRRALVGVPLAIAPPTANGGVGTLAWSVSRGRLPAGLSLGPNGSIGGTPVADGVYDLAISVVDQANSRKADTGVFRLTIEGNAVGTGSLAYVPDVVLQSGTKGVRIEPPPVPASAVLPVVWGYAGGAPWPVDPVTGVMETGTLSSPFTATRSYTLTDAAGKLWKSNVFNMTVAVSGKDVFYNRTDVYAGDAFAVGPDYRGGLGGLVFSGSTAPSPSLCSLAVLPGGIAFDPASGVLSGVMPAAGLMAGSPPERTSGLCLEVEGRDPVDGKVYPATIAVGVQAKPATIAIGSQAEKPLDAGASFTIPAGQSAVVTLAAAYPVMNVKAYIPDGAGRQAAVTLTADGGGLIQVASFVDTLEFGWVGLPGVVNPAGRRIRYVRIGNTSQVPMTIDRLQVQ